MIAIAVLLSVIVIATAMDLTIKHVYRFRKTPHETTPAEFGIPYEEIRILTKNNRQLYGWWIHAGTESSCPGPWLILAHGWGRNLERMMPYVRALYPLGYSLLAFDLRSHGSSDSDTYPNMLKFSEDIRAAVDFLTASASGRPTEIGVIGLSVGGGAAIHAAANDERIRVAVTVGAIAHPLEVMRSEFTKRRLPYIPLGWLMLKYVQLRMGVNFNRIAPVNVISKATAKIFIIHGAQDTVVPVQGGESLFHSGRPATTQLWVVPDKAHSDCHQHPDFWKKVSSFLQEAFAKDHAPKSRDRVGTTAADHR